ncbi:MAG: S8 family serine peptidase, partial [Oscillochloris sp.]|nr:S8 family serine peptidase [Oscillochloris sp.]
MRAVRLLAVGTLLLTSLLIPFIAGAQTDGSTIYLRRASFDPLQEQPAELATVDQSETTLLLAQLDGEPTSTRVAALRSAGLEPLIYIPDNAFLVRTTADSAPQAAGLRWYGSLPPAYKLSAELAAGTDTSMLSLRVTAAPDVDLPTLTAAISAVGGTLDSSYIGLTGTSLAVHLPQSALASFTARDDVIWVEQREIPQLLNNTSRALIGVDTALQELTWLTGAGQIVAVTDSGLDVSDDVSDDFSGRVVATFTPKQMYSGCTTATWSDYYGHGTHVSGSILGSSALSSSGTSFAGVAPGALLVVETATSSNSGGSLDCLSDDDSFLEKAYNAGARIQNASWGSPTGSSPSGYTYGGYDTFAVLVDDFLYNNPEHLLVVAAGNAGVDADRDGVIDADSIGSPATAKNVLAVGASENNRQPTST